MAICWNNPGHFCLEIYPRLMFFCSSSTCLEHIITGLAVLGEGDPPKKNTKSVDGSGEHFVALLFNTTIVHL